MISLVLFIDKLLSRNDAATRAEGNLRFCGSRFVCKQDGITFDVAINPRKKSKITIYPGGRDPNNETHTAKKSPGLDR